jgi:hypothetical protein
VSSLSSKSWVILHDGGAVWSDFFESQAHEELARLLAAGFAVTDVVFDPGKPISAERLLEDAGLEPGYAQAFLIIAENGWVWQNIDEGLVARLGASSDAGILKSAAIGPDGSGQWVVFDSDGSWWFNDISSAASETIGNALNDGAELRRFAYDSKDSSRCIVMCDNHIAFYNNMYESAAGKISEVLDAGQTINSFAFNPDEDDSWVLVTTNNIVWFNNTADDLIAAINKLFAEGRQVRNVIYGPLDRYGTLLPGGGLSEEEGSEGGSATGATPEERPPEERPREERPPEERPREE